MANYGITSDDGGLWPNTYKKAQGHPDKNGHIVITRDQMNMLAQHFRAGHTEVKVKLAAWDRTSKQTHVPYQYVKAEVPHIEQTQQQAPQQAPQQPQQQTAYQPPQQQAPQQTPQQQFHSEFANDDIPF